MSDVPYQGALHLHGQTARTSQFCGAVIRDTTHVLTAAHCVFDNEHTAPGQPAVPGDLEVLVATTTLLSGGQHVQVGAVSIDPNYDPSSFAQDIAILTLAQPLTMGNPITPIDEGAWSNVGLGTPLTVSGWGDTANNPQTKNTDLNRVSVPLTDPAICQAGYTGYDPDVTICAGDGAGDACFGDSGGPLVYRPAGTDRLIGIVSFGGRTCNDAKHPGGYTKLAAPAVLTYATQPQPADAPRNLAPPTVVGTAQEGSTVTCDPGSWAGSPSLAYQFLRPTASGDIALTPLGGQATYALRDGDAGESVRCYVKGTNAGGLAIAASAAVGVAQRDNPQPLAPQPQPEPAPTPQPEPLQDVSSPVARVTSGRCTTTRCTLDVIVTDAGFSAGIKTVTASVRSTYSTTCKRTGKRAKCVKRRTKTASVTTLSANRFRVVASKLPVGLQVFTLVAVDNAGHRQALPTRKTLRTKAKKKKTSRR